MKLNKKRIILISTCFIVLIAIVLGGLKYVNYHNSLDYKLTEVGYSKEEVKSLKEVFKKNEIELLLKKDYNKNIINLGKEKYFIMDNLDRYLSYLDDHDDDLSHAISIVNVGADKSWYADPKKVEVTKDNQYKILVNKFNYLDESYKPDDIKNISIQYAYDKNSVREKVLNAFISLHNAAKKEGLNIIVNSSYRDYAWQKELYDNRVLWYGEAEADAYAARPGFSEHQTALALDFAVYGSDIPFGETEEFNWLQQNADKYGFILRYPEGKEDITGYNYESWHYRYVGADMAKKIKESNLTYDEYYTYYCEYKKAC